MYTYLENINMQDIYCWIGINIEWLLSDLIFIFFFNIFAVFILLKPSSVASCRTFYGHATFIFFSTYLLAIQITNKCNNHPLIIDLPILSKVANHPYLWDIRNIFHRKNYFIIPESSLSLSQNLARAILSQSEDVDT